MKLLVTGAWRHTDEQLNILNSFGNEVVLMPDEKAELPVNAQDIEGVICNGLFLYHDIQDFKNLKFIQLTSAGLDRIDMDYVSKHEIEIHSAKGVYSIPMAEYAIFGVLQLYKQGQFFHNNKQNHIWEKHRGLIELAQKNICIVGCGSVGTECAKRFKAFDCKVNGVDLFPTESTHYDRIYPLEQIEDAITKADVVVLTLPLNESTRHLIDKNMLSKLKKGAVLVNIARGAIVDENALIDALNDNLGGAVLDVFEAEPLSENSPLWDLKNVIITPHNSFIGENNSERLWKIIKDNLENEK